MELPSAEYQGPVSVLLPDAEVTASAALVSWRGEPIAVDERGAVVFDLDPPTEPYWAGTVRVARDSIAPVQVPGNSVRLRFPGGEPVEAELESAAWTEDETLEMAVVGRGPTPF